MILLDGTTLAARRLPLLRDRASAVSARRGRPPSLVLIAFDTEGAGRAPHVDRKAVMCSRAGVDLTARILAPGTAMPDALETLRGFVSGPGCDAVFLQFPFPPEIDGAALADALPAALDVDVMSRSAFEHYMASEAAYPPVTVSAGLELLDAYGVSVAGLEGAVVAAESAFALMFGEALRRRGARVGPPLLPATVRSEESLAHAGLVVVLAESPGMLPAEWIAPGSVAIDVGYYNPGGRGDIDPTGGVGHLAAFAPVPGGIGPMTVSVLIERVIRFAEQTG